MCMKFTQKLQYLSDHSHAVLVEFPAKYDRKSEQFDKRSIITSAGQEIDFKIEANHN